MKIHILLACLSVSLGAYCQQKSNLKNMPKGHSEYLVQKNERQSIISLIEKEEWAKDVFNKLSSRTEVYISHGPEWLRSRLQMYWNTKSSEVFINGEYFSHQGGDAAPVPTVMYSGARSHATNYVRPKLDDVKPYSEDPKGMYLRNKILEGKPYEWANLSKTGTIIQSINQEILGIARDAAFLWWVTGEDKYAELAASVFDTYMQGIYYRNVPKDLNYGHQQTLVGMATFEVIHEEILYSLIPLYDFIHDYLEKEKPDNMVIYSGAFKKWAENIIDNGVPHNNWNLMQARYVMDIALILDDNDKYEDGKGRQHYINCVINESSIRQWSLTDLADYGYDQKSKIWSECPGYSSVVIGDYSGFVDLFDRNLKIDLTSHIPIIPEAVAAMPQYLFPNMMMVGFGDTHPKELRTDIFRSMIRNAQLHGKKDEERTFTSMLRLFDKSLTNKSDKQGSVAVAVASFFADKPLILDENVEAGDINDYVTPTFYGEKVSWLVQRNGMDKRNSLMISQNASDGNHMHANGISMELYGKGLTLAPDAGIGLTLYSGLDYHEYYSQFPSHNTVCVDGISSYPVMKSNHSFEMKNCYPEPGGKVAYKPLSYSEVYFREPESQSDQTRLMGIINTSDTTGYYIDVFRSARSDNRDKMHDYFYHNLGQEMELKEAGGADLNLQPTNELAFAGAHLYAYSYIYNKRSASTEKNIKATFRINMPDNDDITMAMWMKGEKDREVFSALSPATEGLSRTPGMPYNMLKQPTLTFVARQKGEARTRPFVSVFEPYSVSQPSMIESVEYPEISSSGSANNVAVQVKLHNGNRHLILSSDNPAEKSKVDKVTVRSAYAVIKNDGGSKTYFLGGGTLLETEGVRIISDDPADILLIKDIEGWRYTSTTSKCKIIIDGRKYSIRQQSEMSVLK